MKHVLRFVLLAFFCSTSHLSAQTESKREFSSLPTPLQSKIANTFAEDDSRYAIKAGGAELFGFQNAKHGYSGELSRRGLTLSLGGKTWTVRGKLSPSPLGEGRGEVLGEVNFTQSANKLTANYGTYAEWYSNTGLGIQQGWTISEKPAGTFVTLELEETGDIRATLSDSKTLLVNGFRYGGLVAFDAKGRDLAVSFVQAGEKIGIKADKNQMTN